MANSLWFWTVVEDPFTTADENIYFSTGVEILEESKQLNVNNLVDYNTYDNWVYLAALSDEGVYPYRIGMMYRSTEQIDGVVHWFPAREAISKSTYGSAFKYGRRKKLESWLGTVSVESIIVTFNVSNN